MKVQELSLKNFRGFEDVKIEFPSSNLAVFVGINGAGKSSVLDCIAILLSLFTRHLTQGNWNINIKNVDFPFNYNDINASHSHTMNSVKCKCLHTLFPGMPCFALSDEVKTFEWGFMQSISIPSSSEDVLHKKMMGHGSPTMTRNFAEAEDVSTQFNQNPSFNLPILIYYQTNRSIMENLAVERSKFQPQYKQFFCYANAFSKNVTELSDFVTWFKFEEDIENEIKIKKKDLNAVNTRLEYVRTAIDKFLNGLPSRRFSEIHIQREDREREFAFNASKKYSLAITKGEQTLKIEQLSEGERVLLLMVSDIARRLVIANPSLTDPLTGCGIVLIDEIELHLHPQWQRDVLPALLNAFPNVQFIVSTHSPQVLSNVEREDVRIIRDFKIVEQTPHTKGRDSNSILYELLGVEERPELYGEKLKQLYELMGDGKIDEAKTCLKGLAEKFGENDSEILRANMHIMLDEDEFEQAGEVSDRLSGMHLK